MMERYGGLWFERAASAPVIVKEEYDSTLDIVRSVYQRNIDGFFEVAFWVKGPTGPQCSLPLWGSIAEQGIYGTLEEAMAYLDAIEAQFIERKTGRKSTTLGEG
jgi:hypothetical protein